MAPCSLTVSESSEAMHTFDGSNDTFVAEDNGGAPGDKYETSIEIVTQSDKQAHINYHMSVKQPISPATDTMLCEHTYTLTMLFYVTQFLICCLAPETLSSYTDYPMDRDASEISNISSSPDPRGYRVLVPNSDEIEEEV